MAWFVLVDLATLALVVLAITCAKPLLRWQVNAFGRTFSYDTSYLHAILEASTKAMLRLSAFQIFAGQRASLPRDAFFAAGIAGTMTEDCGPCTQLVVKMAEREEVPAATLRGIVAGDLAAAGPDAALAVRFAEAVMARDLVAADALRAEVVAKWGEEGLVSLAFSIATSRVYPTLKYALGFGRACSRVQIAGVDEAVVRQVRLGAG